MDRVYPKSHITMMMGLNTLSFLIGLALAVGPFLVGYYPGSFETTLHVALGALIALLAIFRVLLAYGSIWIDVVLCALGLLVFTLPLTLGMRWDGQYNMGHMAAGGIVMGIAVISAALTVGVVKKLKV